MRAQQRCRRQRPNLWRQQKLNFLVMAKPGPARRILFQAPRVNATLAVHRNVQKKKRSRRPRRLSLLTCPESPPEILSKVKRKRGPGSARLYSWLHWLQFAESPT